MSASMRAKLVISSVENLQYHPDAPLEAQVLHMSGVSRSDGYPPDGSDEDNTFAKFSPSASLSITIANPNLIGQFQPGEKFYVDFTPCVEAVAADPESPAEDAPPDADGI